MAEKINLELDIETKDATKEVNSVVDAINKLGSDLADNNKKIEEGLTAIKSTSEETAGGISKIGGAIKTAGVGLFLVALESVKELFMQNQLVADAVGGAFEGLALVFNDVFGLLTGGLDSVQKIGDAFDKYFGKPIETAVKSFEKFGDAFSKIFGGDFSGALDDFNLGMTGLQAAVSQTGDGFVEAATDIGDYAVGIKDAAVSNIQLAKEAQKAEVINAGLIEKYDRQAEQQRQIRDEERNSITDRIAANVELGRILEEQNVKMLENAKTVERAAQAAFDRNGSLENEIALIAAKNEVMAVEATVEGFRSEQLANDLALNKEKAELTNTQLEAETNLSLERQKFNASQELLESRRLNKLIEINSKEKLIQEERLQRLVDEANAGTQAKVDAQIALDAFTEANRQESISLKSEYDMAIVAEDKLLLDSNIAIAEKNKEMELQKMALREDSFNNLLTITGEETKLGRAILIAKQLMMAKDMIMEAKSTLFSAKQSATKSGIKAAEAGVDSAAGIAKSAAALPFPANIPLIIGYAAQAVGIFSSIRSAMRAQKEATSGLGGVPQMADLTAPSVSAGSATASQAPAFNIVGQSDANQLADAFSSQQSPIKAYVVANDVTTAQSLDRNIIDSATL